MVAGEEDAPAVAEVAEIIEKPVAPVVSTLRVLPGAIEDYEALFHRATRRPCSPRARRTVLRIHFRSPDLPTSTDEL